jgi:hypothetical protein
LDVSYREYPGTRAILASTFTARNAFNAESKFIIRCFFDGAILVETEIYEAPG